MTIEQLVDESKLIVELDNALRKGMEPESRFKLPYKITERKPELLENIAETFHIDANRAQVKIVTGHYENDRTGQVFNYMLEVVMAPRADLGSDNAGTIRIIGNINSTPSIHGGEDYFTGNNAYSWSDKNNKLICSSSLRSILEECGFTTSHFTKMSKKKVPSVLFINLMTPCPDWLGSAGKTHIDLTPYAKDIAKTVSCLAYKMPSYYGQGYGSRESYGDQQKSAKSYLEDFLYDRRNAMQADPSLKYRDPLTQSGVWYRIRPVMVEGGYDPPKNWGKTRKNITNEIDKVCKDLLDLEREDLGIYAKARGMMLYGGHVYPVDMNSFRDLGEKGVFMLIIEKEGIADVLKDAARDSGVALVHTGGRFTKYVKYLIEHARVPSATLTDYDADGIEIAAGTINETPRVGIDMDIVDWLQHNGYPDLLQENVEEEYKPRIQPDDEYLKTHRIELDSIIAFPNQPGRGPEALWKYVRYRIEELQKEEGFNYSNIITEPEPEELYPEAISDLISKLRGYVHKIIEDEWEIICEQELTAVKKLISIKEQEVNNVEVLSKKIEEDEIMQEEIIPKVDKLLGELSDLLD